MKISIIAGILTLALVILPLVGCTEVVKEVEPAPTAEQPVVVPEEEESPELETLQPITTTIPEPELGKISEPLKYRILDSFTTEAMKDVRHHVSMRGYDLPSEIVEWPDFALYIVVQNLDDVLGTFKVRYTLSTADKNAAERQQWLVQRTPEEYAELDREYYEGSIELYLEPGEVGIAICPLDGIYIAPDRVPFSHEHAIIPETKKGERR